MPDEFDPYLAWLGIPATSRPPNHYQLLGLAEFERDLARIAAAADARMGEVRKYQTGPRGRFTQKILNELSAARLCLLDPRAKEGYDGLLLRQRETFHYPAWQPAAVMYAPLEGPPMAAPPAAPPPKQASLPAHRPMTPEAAPADQSDADAANASNGWWLVLGLFFAVVIGGAGAAVYMVSLRTQRSPRPEVGVVAPVVVAPVVAPEETELIIAQEGNGDLSFPASTAELSEGLTRNDRSGESLIAGWKSETTIARWRFRTVRPAVFQVRLIYTAQTAAGAQWQLRIDDEVKVREVQSAEGAEGVVTDEFFWRVSRSGDQTFELSTLSLPEGATVTLKSVRFVYQPGGRLQ